MIKANGKVFSEFYQQFVGADEIDIGNGIYFRGGRDSISGALSHFKNGTCFVSRNRWMRHAHLQVLRCRVLREESLFSKNKTIVAIIPNAGLGKDRITVDEVRNYLVMTKTEQRMDAIDQINPYA